MSNPNWQSSWKVLGSPVLSLDNTGLLLHFWMQRRIVLSDNGFSKALLNLCDYIDYGSMTVYKAVLCESFKTHIQQWFPTLAFKLWDFLGFPECFHWILQCRLLQGAQVISGWCHICWNWKNISKTQWASSSLPITNSSRAPPSSTFHMHELKTAHIGDELKECLDICYDYSGLWFGGW